MTPALKQVLWKKNIQLTQLLQNNLMSDNDLTIFYLMSFSIKEHGHGCFVYLLLLDMEALGGIYFVVRRHSCQHYS